MAQNLSVISAEMRRLHWGFGSRFSGNKKKSSAKWNVAEKRWLLISMPDAISQSQIFPFHFFRGDFRRAANVEIWEISLNDFERQLNDISCSPTAVFFQFWIDKTQLQANELAKRIRKKWPNAKIIFLDPFAPTDLRYAEALNGEVDLYFKKHALRNRNMYGQQTRGDTNLSHWYGEKYGIDQTETCYGIPDGFLDKLKICPTFFLAPYLITRFTRVAPQNSRLRRFDLHARLGGAGPVGWYPTMRQHAIDRVQILTDFTVTPSGMIGRREYLREIANSMACFSPFGYGEVCWRDYEAVAYGSVLIKPDMDHVETVPNIFVPWETYAPIAWDFSDLGSVLYRLKASPELRQKLVQQSFEVLSKYVRERRFVHFVVDALYSDA